MRIFCLVWLFAGLVSETQAAQINFDFSKYKPGQMPPAFVSLVTGEGKAADWSVVEESVPPALAPILDQARATVTLHPVLSVQSLDPDPNHFPLLLFTNEIFSDFVFTTRFKISGGVTDPMAGVILRAQDPNNYYVVRASTEGNLLWYRVVNGQSYERVGIGVRMPIPKDVWMELRVECSGVGTRCFLDGKLVIPPVRAGAPTNGLAVNDTTFVRGKIGFWCKADTKCSFVDASIHYVPKVAYAELVTDEIKQRYPRLLGLKIYVQKDPGLPIVVGDFNAANLGSPGTKYDSDVIENGVMYYLKDGDTVEVTMPLRDRNGDVAAAIQTRMKSFKGETKDTALMRATVIRKAIEKRLADLGDVTE